MTILTGIQPELDRHQLSELNVDLLSSVLRGADMLVSGDDRLANINHLLAEIGAVTQVSRVWVFQVLAISDTDILQDYVFEWANEKKYAQIRLPHFNHFSSSLAHPEYRKLIESRQRGEYQSVITDQLPSSWLKRYLTQQRILSMLTIPIIVDNKWWGTLGFDDCDREQRWSESDVTLLRATGHLIASTVLKNELFSKQRQIDIIKDNTHCSTWQVDVQRGICWCSSEIIGDSATSSIRDSRTYTSRHWLRRIHPGYRRAFFSRVRHFLSPSGNELKMDLQVKRDNGEYTWVEITTNNDPKNKPQGVVAGVMWDISQRKAEEQALMRQAATDPLTQLYNRRQFASDLARFGEQARYRHQPLSLLIIDIDHFKRINDNYGHIVGDHVLEAFASLLETHLPLHSNIYRIGGEEFACLLANTDQKAAQHYAAQLCEAVYDQHSILDYSPAIRVSVSIGCAELDAAMLDAKHLYQHADDALYNAKLSGRNRVVSYA